MPILSQLDPVHNPTSIFLKTHLNNIFPSTPSSPQWPLSGFPTKTLYTILFSLRRSTRPAHLTLLDLITRTIFGEQYRSVSYSLLSFLHSTFTSSLLGPNILLNNLLSNTISLRSSLCMSYHVSYPYKTGKITYLCIFDMYLSLCITSA